MVVECDNGIKLDISLWLREWGDYNYEVRVSPVTADEALIEVEKFLQWARAIPREVVEARQR